MKSENSLFIRFRLLAFGLALRVAAAALLALVEGCMSGDLRIGVMQYTNRSYSEAEHTLSKALVRDPSACGGILLKSARRIQAELALSKAIKYICAGEFENAASTLEKARTKDPGSELIACMALETAEVRTRSADLLAEAERRRSAGDFAGTIRALQLVSASKDFAQEAAKGIEAIRNEVRKRALAGALAACENEDYSGALAYWANCVRFTGLDEDAEAGIRQCVDGIAALNSAQKARDYLEAGGVESAYELARKNAKRFGFSRRAEEVLRLTAQARARQLTESAREHDRLASQFSSRQDACKGFRLAQSAFAVCPADNEVSQTVRLCGMHWAGFLDSEQNAIVRQSAPALVPTIWAMEREKSIAQGRDPAKDKRLCSIREEAFLVSRIHLAMPKGANELEEATRAELARTVSEARMPQIQIHRSSGEEAAVAERASILEVARQIGPEMEALSVPRVFSVNFSETMRIEPVEKHLENRPYRVFDKYKATADTIRKDALASIEPDYGDRLEEKYRTHEKLTAAHQEALQELTDRKNIEKANNAAKRLMQSIVEMNQEFIQVLQANQFSETAAQSQAALAEITKFRGDTERLAQEASNARQKAEENEQKARAELDTQRREIDALRKQALDKILEGISLFDNKIEPQFNEGTVENQLCVMNGEGALTITLEPKSPDDQPISIQLTAKLDREDKVSRGAPFLATEPLLNDASDLPTVDEMREEMRRSLYRQAGPEIVRRIVSLLQADMGESTATPVDMDRMAQIASFNPMPLSLNTSISKAAQTLAVLAQSYAKQNGGFPGQTPGNPNAARLECVTRYEILTTGLGQPATDGCMTNPSMTLAADRQIPTLIEKGPDFPILLAK